MIRNSAYLLERSSLLFSRTRDSSRWNFQRAGSSGKPQKPVVRDTTPIYREEGSPVLFDIPKTKYIASDEINPTEDPSTIPSKEDYVPSTRTEKTHQLSPEEIKVLSHYAAQGRTRGILEPFEQTFKKLATFCQQRPFLGLRSINKDYAPVIAVNALVMPTATIVGRVEIFNDTSIWYNCIIKAHTNAIKIGGRTNIQDGTVIVESPEPLGLDHDGSTVVGHHVTVGHNCVLHACTVEDRCLIGMGSVLENDSYMETMSMLGAGSILKSGSRVKTNQLWVGNPARYVRDLTGMEVLSIENSARHYVDLAKEHLREHPPLMGTLNPLTNNHINV